MVLLNKQKIRQISHTVAHIKYVADHIRIDFEVRRDNRSQHPDYRELYTSKSKDIVFQVYREDIKKLKYEF